MSTADTSATSTTLEPGPTTTLAAAPVHAEPSYPVCGRELGFYIESLKPVANEPTSQVATLAIVNAYGPDCSIRGFLQDVRFSDQTQEFPTTVSQLDTSSPESWLDLEYNPANGGPTTGAKVEIYTTSLDEDGKACPTSRMFTAAYINFTIPDTGRRFEFLTAPVDAPEGAPGLASCDARLAITPIAPLKS